MIGSLVRARGLPKALVGAVGVATLVAGLLGGAADALDNRQQNPVAGDPRCVDVFPGSSQVRSDPPGRDENPTGTVPPQHHTGIAGFEELVGVIVHGGASGSNVYDPTTGMQGRLIPTRNPGGGLAELEHTLLCYSQFADPTASTATLTLVYSDSGHQVEVLVAVTLAPTTTTEAGVSPSPPPSGPVAPTISVPPFDVIPQAPPAAPIVGQPTFTG